MDELTYYKLKLLATETQFIKLRAEQAIALAIERQRAAFKQAGLDISSPFRFDDNTHEILPDSHS